METKIVDNQEHRVHTLQDACGFIFILISLVNITYMMLEYLGVWHRSGWLVQILGILSLTGYAILFKLSSNYTAELFAGVQMGLELFFCFVMHPLVNDRGAEQLYFVALLYTCIGFSLLSLYFWSMLFYNSRFQAKDFRWLVFMPLPYVVNIIFYWCTIQMVEGRATESVKWVMGGTPEPVLCLLSLLVGYGYWRLSHTEAFSGNSDTIAYPKLSPLNVYALLYLGLPLLIFFIF